MGEQNEATSAHSLHTVGPDYPGVTGTPAEGTRDMDRVRAEDDEDEEDEGDD